MCYISLKYHCVNNKEKKYKKSIEFKAVGDNEFDKAVNSFF